MKKKKKKVHHTALSLRERIEIEYQYKYGATITSIAIQLGRNKSTISRELKGKDRTGVNKYLSNVAHDKALKRIKNRGNTCLLDKNKELYDYVVEKLKLYWTPEIISGRIKKDFTKDESMHISHEAIYQYIYSSDRIYSNGKMKDDCEDLRMYLPRSHKRRAKKGARRTQKALNRAEVPSIEERSIIVEKRSRIGDWEDDFLVSRASNVCIKSVNERRSGLVFFGKTEDRTAKAGDAVLVDKLRVMPSEYLCTLTRDNGPENKNYKEVEKILGLKVYFANPYHSWERGSNENCNGLLRRFFPKGTDWSKITDVELAKAEYLINTRPRKRLGWRSPAEVFYQETGVALFC